MVGSKPKELPEATSISLPRFHHALQGRGLCCFSLHPLLYGAATNYKVIPVGQELTDSRRPEATTPCLLSSMMSGALSVSYFFLQVACILQHESAIHFRRTTPRKWPHITTFWYQSPLFGRQRYERLSRSFARELA